jgi:hypothetical protein
MPRRFPIFQFPNAPLIAAVLASARTAKRSPSSAEPEADRRFPRNRADDHPHQDGVPPSSPSPRRAALAARRAAFFAAICRARSSMVTTVSGRSRPNRL